MRTPHVKLAALAAAFMLLTACEHATEPLTPMKALAATYVVRATTAAAPNPYGSLTFSTTENGIVTEHTAAGAEIRLVLAADGTTSGRLFVPNVDDEDGGAPSDFEANLAGTWSVAGDVVTLRHAADTFLRDMPLTAQNGQLVGDKTFGSVRVRVTLGRE